PVDGCVFFFQAEDGIRYFHVTGVQTCALPISAERAPTENRISRLESTTKSQISAFGKISSALSGLQDVLAKFAGDGALPGRKVSVSDDAGFSATANAKAALGRYGVTVETLASTHKLQPAALASDAQLGHGSLSISVGDGDPVTVEIAEGKGSLSDIRDAINKQAGSLGVSATLVRGDSGDVLVLASTVTGSEGRLT